MVSAHARSSRTSRERPWRSARAGSLSGSWAIVGASVSSRSSTARCGMRVLYGVVGEGMGHATRSRVILEHLLGAGHDVHVVVSGRAHKFFVDKFTGRQRISIDEIAGLHLKFEGNDLDLSESLRSNLGN